MMSNGSSSPLPADDMQRSPLSIIATLTGKRIFLTGGTGFVGKVIVEKILRSCPSIETIYLLVRPRKGSSADARMKQEVVESDIFSRLKSEIGTEAFYARANSKLRAVAGEMTQESVGLSKEDMQTLQKEVDYVIHCAAIVDFNERIDRAVELNVLGSLRLLNVFQSSTRIAGFVHVSTCYVNSNRRGWIDERLYDLGFDPKEMLNKISSLKQSELEKITGTGILGDWPNTYTFTKAITEHLLVQNRGKIPLAIVRPSIVGGSAREPVPGWVDVISAAGAVYLSAGLGVLKFLPGSADNIADLVPVDYVANAIIAAIPAISKQDRHIIFHAATSSEKPMYWGNACDTVVNYFQRHPPDKRLGPPTFQIIENPTWYQWQFFLHYSIPSALLTSLSTTPLAPKSYRVKAAQFERLVFRARIIVEAFRHFVENEWRYNNRNTRAIGQSLVDEEREVFCLSLDNFHWDEYNMHFAHGLLKFVLKVDLNPVPVDTERTININRVVWKPNTGADRHSVLSYLKPFAPQITRAHELWADRPLYPKARPTTQMVQLLLQNPAVQLAIRNENERVANAAKSSKRKPRTPTVHAGVTLSPGEARARSIMSKMFSDINDNVLASVGYMFQNLWSRMYDAISVDAAGLQKVQAVVQQYSAINQANSTSKKCPIIFIPTHRSYIDFLVVSYVCYQTQLPLPHIAAGEDFLGILLVRWLFRHSGAFFMKRSIDAKTDALYHAIFSSYLKQLMIDGQSLEFFIEGTRSRSGKMLQPKQGLLSILTDCVLDNSVDDAYIVPIAINYEQTMEGELYSSELLGEQKIRESLKSLLKSMSVINQSFGDIHVSFGDPISVKQYAASITQQVQGTDVNRLTQALIQTKLASALTPQETAKQTIKTTKAPVTSLISVSAPPAAPKSDSTIKSSSKALTVQESSLRAFNPVTSADDRKYFNYLLSYSVVNSLTRSSSVMPTSIVASFMLMYRQGISHKQLIANVDWCRRELDARGAKTWGLQGEDRVALVDRALNHLSGLVVQQRSGVYEPNIAAKAEYRNMLVLGHYRNKLVHHFFREAIWACALYSFGHELEQGVPKAELMKQVAFLYALLHREFIIKSNPTEPEDYESTLRQMIGRGCLVERADGRIEIATTGEALFSFLCALLWPFIDSYFVAALTLFSLQPEKSVDEPTLLRHTQWLATTLYHESMLCFYESCSMDTLRNAFRVFTQWNVIDRTKRQLMATTPPMGSASTESTSEVFVSLVGDYRTEVGLQDLVARIDRARKQPPVKRNAIRRNLIADIPILAKL